MPVPHPPIEAQKHEEPIEIDDLDVGSVVVRRGQLVRIVKVSRETDPPSFSVCVNCMVSIIFLLDSG